MTGYRTLLFNAAVIAGTAGLQYIAGTDLTAVFGPTWSVVIVAAANFLLRFVTRTPVGAKA